MAANEKLGDIYVKAANRELNDEEKMQVLNLTREIEECEREMRGINLDVTNQEALKSRREVEKKAAFREVLDNLRSGKEREILLNSAAGNVSANIAASGAIQLTIHDLIPTLHEGLDLPKGLRVVTGVEGNEVWPVSINDVEMEEVGEVEALSDQVLDFAKITPTPNRIGLTVPISNAAIDNAAFDVLAFVQQKFGIALRTYLAKKIYSLADWTKNRGPFSGKKASAGTIELGANAYKNILAKVAEFSNKGFFEGDVCLCMDRVTEAELKATPKVAGAAAGFVIEGGLCAGYPYVVSHFVNTELNSADELVPTADRYLEVGYYEWFALQQHGVVRMSADSTSQAVAKKNITAITLNSFWSMTDLSVYINGANGSQAFGLYKIVEPEPTQA
jgi:hypothetical protein